MRPHDDVVPLGHDVETIPHEMTQLSLDARTHDGVAHRLRDDKTDARPVSPGGVEADRVGVDHVNDKQRTTGSPRAAITQNGAVLAGVT